MRKGYATAGWLFVRLLGVVYAVAFLSLGWQIRGLVGSDGILPAAEYLAEVSAWAADNDAGVAKYRLVPTLFWISASDRVLQGSAFAGAALGALVALGVAPAAMLPVLWLLYLSIASVGREFLGYQWDALLLETGLLAIVLAPRRWRDRLGEAADPPRVARWLLWWLAFRLMFASGLVKLASGDPAWRNLTALAFHFETQPLPTPVAWYVHALPLAAHRAATALTLAAELILPLLLLTRLRRAAAFGLIGLQGLIALTGNYGFFNLLTAALCVLFLDDAAFTRVRRPEGLRLPPMRRPEGLRLPPMRRPEGLRPPPMRRPEGLRLPPMRRPEGLRLPARGAAVVMAAITLPVSVMMFAAQLGFVAPPFLRPLRELARPFRSINQYGLFAVMTTRRLEIEVEGSMDGREWRAYRFTYKPGPLERRPPWVAPLQPRLDWQMWFAALSRPEEEVWFDRFLSRLRERSPSVLALLDADPFPGQSPQYLRATLYHYRFTAPGHAAAARSWWVREPIGRYVGASRDPVTMPRTMRTSTPAAGS